MSHAKKIRLFIILGIIVGIMSLGSSLMVLSVSYSSSGTAEVENKVFLIELDKITNLYTDDETVKVLKNPKLKDNNFEYGVELQNVGSSTQFQFDIINKGDIAGKVSEIDIQGYNDYKDYIEIKVDGIEVGDIIEPGKVLKKINVYTSYKNPYYDENGNLKVISLNQIQVKIGFESMKGDFNEKES